MTYPSYFKKFYKFFENLFKKPQRFTYVAIGDSTAEGIGASHHSKSIPGIVYRAIKRNQKKATLANLGKSGATIKNVIEKQLPKALELNPQLVTISIGANDLRQRTKIVNFESDLEFLIQELKEKTDARIVVNNIPDLTALPSVPFIFKFFTGIFLKRFNQAIERVVKKFSVIFIDVYTSSKLFSRKYPELVSSDGIHPSDAGYALWANAILPQILRN